MKKIVWALLVTALPFTSMAQTTTPSAKAADKPLVLAGTTCSKLAKSYSGISKEMATLVTDSVGDNSAPRETIRQIKVAGLYSKAALIADLIAAHKCPTPKAAPDSTAYLEDALKCANATMSLPKDHIERTKACDTALWTPAYTD